MLIPESETPPAGAGGIFWLQAKNELEPFGLPLHLQTGVWSFMRLNKNTIKLTINITLKYFLIFATSTK